MFCTKCGKQIDDNSTFCNFCGAPINNGAQPAMPQQAPTQQAPVQQAPVQSSAPQYATPKAAGGAVLNLPSNIDAIIQIGLKGAIAISALLVIIGCIGSMGSLGSMVKNAFGSLFGSSSGLMKSAQALYGFLVLIRVSAILTFVFTVSGAVYTVLTKQKQKAAYICAVFGTLIFIFHFIMFGIAMGAVLGGVVAFGIIIMLLAVTLISMSVYVVFKNGYIKTILKK